jgi:hypothetical protein
MKGENRVEPPLSVKLRKVADGIQACCPELDLSSTGEDGQSALGQLASEISSYWDRLSEDEDFRAIDSHQEHYSYSWTK